MYLYLFLCSTKNHTQSFSAYTLPSSHSRFIYSWHTISHAYSFHLFQLDYFPKSKYAEPFSIIHIHTRAHAFTYIFYTHTHASIYSQNTQKRPEFRSLRTTAIHTHIEEKKKFLTHT